MVIVSEAENVVPVDFNAKGYLEQYIRRNKPGSYKSVRDGTLKELIEYSCMHNRGVIGIYRITVGTDKYAGQAIRGLFHSLNFPKSSNRTRSPTRHPARSI